MKVKAYNEEVVYPDEEIVHVTRSDMETLQMQALKNPRKRMRLCSHQNVEDRLHEMLIIHTNETYVRPHKHIHKSESFHVIKGRVDVLIFDDEGRITNLIEMGDYDSRFCFYYRIATPLFHSLIIHSDVLIFHEATNGPFNRSDTVFADWSPDDSDPGAVREFMMKINAECTAFKTKKA